MDWDLLVAFVSVLVVAIFLAVYAFNKFGLKGLSLIFLLEICIVVVCAKWLSKNFVTSLKHITIDERSAFVSFIFSGVSTLLVLNILVAVAVVLYKRVKNKTDGVSSVSYGADSE